MSRLLHIRPIVNCCAARQNFAYPRRFIVVLLRRTSLYASQNDFFAPRSALFWRAARSSFGVKSRSVTPAGFKPAPEVFNPGPGSRVSQKAEVTTEKAFGRSSRAVGCLKHLTSLNVRITGGFKPSGGCDGCALMVITLKQFSNLASNFLHRMRGCTPCNFVGQRRAEVYDFLFSDVVPNWK